MTLPVRAPLWVGTQRVGAEVSAAERLEDAVEALHEGLRTELGFDHAYVMLVDETGQRLFTLSSHGFAQSGVGSEVPLGEGPIGIAAQRGLAVRIPNVVGDHRYASAIARAEPGPQRSIPLPTLQSDGSLLAVPFFRQRRACGVLVALSGSAAFFSAEHEQALSLLGMLFSLKLDVQAEHEADELPPPPGSEPAQRTLRVRHYADDDSLFIDDAYVIKGVAGRLLARVLSVHAETGRRTFTNRELRLEIGSRLSWARDNLDSRLLLLRQRLKEKDCGVMLERSARGVLELTVAGRLQIEVLPPG